MGKSTCEWYTRNIYSEGEAESLHLISSPFSLFRYSLKVVISIRTIQKRVKQSHVKESILASMNMQCEKSSRKIFCLAQREGNKIHVTQCTLVRVA